MWAAALLRTCIARQQTHPVARLLACCSNFRGLASASSETGTKGYSVAVTNAQNLTSGIHNSGSTHKEQQQKEYLAYLLMRDEQGAFRLHLGRHSDREVARRLSDEARVGLGKQPLHYPDDKAALGSSELARRLRPLRDAGRAAIRAAARELLGYRACDKQALNSTQYVGVFKRSAGRYEAACKLGGCNYYLGSYDTPEQAARVHDRVALRLGGHNAARTNNLYPGGPGSQGFKAGPAAAAAAGGGRQEGQQQQQQQEEKGGSLAQDGDGERVEEVEEESGGIPEEMEEVLRRPDLHGHELLREVRRVARGAFKSRCSSQFQGASFLQRQGLWLSYIRIQGVRRDLGYFPSEQSAARSYDMAVLHFGLVGKPHRRLNFPAAQYEGHPLLEEARRHKAGLGEFEYLSKQMAKEERQRAAAAAALQQQNEEKQERQRAAAAAQQQQQQQNEE